MLKGSMGQFGDFLSRCEEDVVVLAHTHTWKEHEIESTKNGDIFYINTGTWIDYASDVSIPAYGRKLFNPFTPKGSPFDE